MSNCHFMIRSEQCRDTEVTELIASLRKKFSSIKQFLRKPFVLRCQHLLEKNLRGLFLLYCSVKIDWHCSITKGKRSFISTLLRWGGAAWLVVMYAIYMDGLFTANCTSISSGAFYSSPELIAAIIFDFTDMPTETEKQGSFFLSIPPNPSAAYASPRTKKSSRGFALW